MSFMPRALRVLAAAATLSVSITAQAEFSKLVVFGDSLSDNGNLYALVGQPPAPYWQGRFSNGPVAAEVMAQQLGLDLEDYAYGGAKTGTGNSGSPLLNGTGVQGQIGSYSQALAGAGQQADPNALYMVWAGPNDFFSTSPAQWPSVAVTAAANLKADIEGLYQLGARNFFVPLMPDLGLTANALAQDATQPGSSAYASARSAEFNSLLSASLATIDAAWDGTTVFSFDTAGFLQQQAAALAGQGYNVTQACLSNGSVCADPGKYLFWDGVHPTAAAHAILGQAFAAAVPEVSTNVLLLIGLAGTAVAMRMRRPAR